MSAEPSWLTPETSTGAAAPAPAPSAPDTFAVNTSTNNNDFAGANTSTTSAATDDELQGMILTMRVANMAVSVALVTCSVS